MGAAVNQEPAMPASRRGPLLSGRNHVRTLPKAWLGFYRLLIQDSRLSNEGEDLLY
jgi:hypothetical protein